MQGIPYRNISVCNIQAHIWNGILKFRIWTQDDKVQIHNFSFCLSIHKDKKWLFFILLW